MASESEPENGPADQPTTPASEAPPSAQATPSDRPRKKKAKRPRPPIPRTEEEIDSPTKQTVGMLGILCIMTVIMWAFARGACNYHPPKETRTPRSVTTVDLAHDPKNAAIELQQRWLTRDFDGALELATGDVVSEIQRDKAACNAACLAQKPALQKTVLTSAMVTEMNPMGATVRVTSVGLPEGSKAYVMHLERADTIWKVNDHKVDTAPPYVVPTTVPATDSAAPSAVGTAVPTMGAMSPAVPSASGAAVVKPSASGAQGTQGTSSKTAPMTPKPVVPAPAASH